MRGKRNIHLFGHFDTKKNLLDESKFWASSHEFTPHVLPHQNATLSSARKKKVSHFKAKNKY